MRAELILAVAMGCGLWMTAAAGIAGAGQDLQTVRDRLFLSLTDIPNTQRLTDSAERWIKSMRMDGSWEDQDYADTTRERWKCGNHLPRVLDLATASRLKDFAPEQRAKYTDAAVRSLEFWLKRDPQNLNWWHNEIGVPLQVGNALILLGSDVPEEVRAHGIELMKRSRWTKWTGQNLVWGTRIQIIRSCVSGDAQAAAGAFARMYEEVHLNPGRAEGVKPDWSFYQHGELLYSGGYGAGFTSDCSRLALLARETSFAIPREKLEILVNHLLDGQAWMTRGHYWDYSATGREIVRRGKNARSLATPARDLAVLCPQRKEELLALAGRLSDAADAKPLRGNRQFWYSDYMVHQRPEWFASAKMYSSRTKNTDPLINGESRKSHFLAEGATYVLLGGNEYEDIFPVWDWHKIPGTTVDQDVAFDPKQVSHLGTERFVGGVSDGTFGCATMDLATGKLKAKKSWFFFDQGFVALGAGINCGSDGNVVTTINQCLMKGEVITSAGKLPRGEHPRDDISWAWHARIGYIPLERVKLKLRNDVQKGSWNEISSGSSSEPVKRDVFLADIDHGVAPVDAHYAYLVLPAVSAEETQSALESLPISVISNTTSLQAVRNAAQGITQAIFREPGTVDCGRVSISVDRACAMVVRQAGDQLTITVANPLNEPADVQLSISANGKTSKVAIKLPGGEDAGRSVSVTTPLSR